MTFQGAAIQGAVCDGVNVFNANSVEWMRWCISPPSGVDRFKYDVTITDPPYTDRVHRNIVLGGKSGKVNIGFDPIDHLWIGDCLKITNRWVVSFCAVEQLGLIEQSFQKEYVRGCAWYKRNSMGQLTRDRPASAFESIAVLHPTGTKKRWNGRGSYNVWSCSGTRGKKDRHPTEKPLDLALKLVALFSERGETVFDPFCGSGTIGEACLLLGRKYEGIEIDGKWADRARERLVRVVQSGAAGSVTDEYALGLCSIRGDASDAPAKLAGE